MHTIPTAKTLDVLSRLRSLPLRLIDRLLEADDRHRERFKLAQMPAERLHDMGIPQHSGPPRRPADQFVPGPPAQERQLTDAEWGGWDAPLWWWR